MTYNTEALPPLPEQAGQGCDGSGTIRAMTSHLGPDDYEFDQCCPACHGTGSADLRDAINALGYWTHKTDVERIVIERSAVLRIISARAALAQRQEPASEAMPCGHHSSLQLKSAETGEPPYCELCDAQSGRRDAEQRESELAAANAERRAKLAEALAQRQQVPTTAWLVEWRFNGVQWLYLWSSAPGGFSFTSDASKALRFARREDAEAALQWARDTDAARRPIGSLTRQGLALGEMLVTEHAWPTFTAAPSAQAERRVECDACPTALGCLGKCMKATPPVAQAEPQVPLPYGFESGLVQLLNEARCLEGRIVGNRELASRIVDYIRRGIGKQEL